MSNKITGFRVGRVEFTLEKPAFVADVLREHNIDPGNGVVTIGGVAHGTSALDTARVDPGQDIEVSPSGKGGEGCYWYCIREDRHNAPDDCRNTVDPKSRVLGA